MKRKIISILSAVIIFICFNSISVFAESIDSFNVQAVDSTSFSESEQMGLTTMEINLSKSGSSLTINVVTESSEIANQIGFRNGYVQYYSGGSWLNAAPLGTYYSTNTDYNSKYLGYTMTSGVQYRISLEHYCIINGTTYKQTQITSAFSM